MSSRNNSSIRLLGLLGLAGGVVAAAAACTTTGGTPTPGGAGTNAQTGGSAGSGGAGTGGSSGGPVGGAGVVGGGGAGTTAGNAPMAGTGGGGVGGAPPMCKAVTPLNGAGITLSATDISAFKYAAPVAGDMVKMAYDP